MLRSVCSSKAHHRSTVAGISTKTDVVGNDEISPMVYNRNPRNLERLRIAYKPNGYHLEVPGRAFWHKLMLEQKSRYIEANLLHHSGANVVTASTKEWSIKKHLYRSTDMSAYTNLAKVFAERCMESGITEMLCDLKPVPDGKVAAFISELEKAGISLTEPPRFLPHRPWDQLRPEKPWEVFE